MERSAQEMARYPAVYSPSEIVFQDAYGDTVTEFIGPRAIANLTARSTGARPYNRTKSLVMGTAHPRSKIGGYLGNASSPLRRPSPPSGPSAILQILQNPKSD